MPVPSFGAIRCKWHTFGIERLKRAVRLHQPRSRSWPTLTAPATEIPTSDIRGVKRGGIIDPVAEKTDHLAARLYRTRERLASDSDQSDLYVCPAKERADIKRSNPTRSGTRSLTDELAELRGLDPTALKQRWRVLYRTEAPVHIGRALLLQAVAYRLQERVLGGLRPELP